MLSPSLLAWARAFDASARHRSFTRAAAELNLTQGAVSQQVRHLEEALGSPLFVRRPRDLELTPEGRRLAPALGGAFAAIGEALSEANAPGGPVAVTLSCSPSFALRWLNPRLAGLADRARRVDLRVFGEFHRLDAGTMRAEGLDIAIRYDDATYDGLVVDDLLDERLVAVASPAWLGRRPGLAERTGIDGGSLLHDTRPWHGAREDEEWRSFADAVGLELRGASGGKRFNLSQLAIDAALAGEGVAIGRLALVMHELEAGRLVPALPFVVRSGAGYRLMSEREAPPRIATIRSWLASEANAFADQRDRLVAGLGLTPRG